MKEIIFNNGDMNTSPVKFFLMLALIALVGFGARVLIGTEKSDAPNPLLVERNAQYQDILVNDEVVFKGRGPCCESRYAAILPILESYKRPITVLELGANNGYFSLRIARDFDATCVMVDGTKRLLKICELNTQRDNIIYLKKWFQLEDFQKLAQEDHFDVVLCFHVLHHLEPWKEIADEIFKLGDNIIIETPPYNDLTAPIRPTIPLIEQYLLNKPGGEIIAKTPRKGENVFGTMFWFKGERSIEKTKGIKYSLFQTLNGVYPTPEMLDHQLVTFLGDQPISPDEIPDDLILQGKRVIKDFHYSP